MEPVADFDKKQLNMQVVLKIDDQLTWGELRNFVEVAIDEDPAAQVGIDYDQNHELTGFYVFVSELTQDTLRRA
jgi:hypothetical protein